MTPTHHDLIQINAMIDRHQKRLPLQIIQDYLNEICKAPSITTKAAFDADAAICAHGTPPSAICLGLSADISFLSIQLCRVFAAGTFHRWHTSAPISSLSTERFIDLCKENSGRRQILKTVCKSNGSSRGHYWLAATSDVRKVLEPLTTSDEWANATRELLGLNHHGKYFQSLMVIYTPEFFSDAKIPTFVDGVENIVFATWDDPKPSTGFTWHLRLNNRGAREVVSTDRRPMDSASIDLEYLGEISRQTRPNLTRLANR